MLDQRGRLLVAALGFAGLAQPTYDRALHALRVWLNSWRGIGDVERGRPSAHALRRAGLAGDLLHDGDGALDHERHAFSVGAHALARDGAGSVGGTD